LAKFGKIVLLRSDIRREGGEHAQQHHSTVNELLRPTLLERAIIQAILAGKQPRCVRLRWFQRHPLPADWAAQRPTSNRSRPFIVPLKSEMATSWPQWPHQTLDSSRWRTCAGIDSQRWRAGWVKVGRNSTPDDDAPGCCSMGSCSAAWQALPLRGGAGPAAGASSAT
jgi:hypothetical protein